MRLSEISYSDTPPIDAYGPGFFRVEGKMLDGAHLILPTGVFAWGGYTDIARLVAAAARFDILLVGTGAETAHPPADFRRAIEDAGLGVEPMATPAACRTYNILLSEGRRIAAALIPV